MANTRVVEFDNAKILYSYDEPVAYVDFKRNLIVRTLFKFSATTTKHINKFVNEYLETYPHYALIEDVSPLNISAELE